MAPAQVVRWVKQAYPKPVINSEWLDACCEWVANELHLNPDTQSQAFITEVENQLLESDLRDSTETATGLPRNAPAMNNERIRGMPILVEVTAIMEIGHSAFSLHNVRQARIERADLAGLAQEEGVEDEEGTVPNYPKSMLKLTLCDGTVTMPAIEYKSIPGLRLDETPLGYKILLKDVLVRRGIIFLEPQGIVLKGHMNSERDEHRDRDFVRGLLKRMMKPIPADEPPPNDDNINENQPPPRASPYRPSAQAAVAQEQVRSPLREVSEPPEPRPDGMDMDDDADLPRKRRIPNLQQQQQQPLAPSAVSSSSTLVASRFFSGSSNTSSSSETNALTQRLARVLSPVRGDPIDITDSSMGDTVPPPRVTPTPGPTSSSRSTGMTGTTSGKQDSGPGSGSGSKTLRTKISYEEFEFDDEFDGELDAAFLAEIAKVEKEALVKQNQRVAQAVAQSRATSEVPKAQDVRAHTPLPVLPSKSASSSSAHAHASVPTAAPARRPQAPLSKSSSSARAVARGEVIQIEDEEEDDKENVPVPKRRVRRRVSTTPDDVIDISD